MHDGYAHLLASFRSAMPSVAGVVLADASGRSVASDAVGVDPHRLAARACSTLTAGCSVLLAEGDARYLVVVMPS